MRYLTKKKLFDYETLKSQCHLIARRLLLLNSLHSTCLTVSGILQYSILVDREVVVKRMLYSHAVTP